MTLPIPALPPEDLNHVLRNTEPLWADLRDARLFITGGTGFFGRWLVESFLAANRAFDLHARAVVLTRDPAAAARRIPRVAGDTAVTFHDGDVRNFVFPAFAATHVIHAATTSSAALNVERPLEMVDTIVKGTRLTMEYARACRAQRVLHVSSGAVYGVQPPALESVDEEYPGGPDPLDPRQAYAEGKRLSELIAVTVAGDAPMDVPIARGFAFVGPGLPLDAHFAIGNFIRDALAGGPVRLSGDGSPFRSYLHAADLAVWLWTLLLRGRTGRAYNVGSERAISVYDLARLVADLAPQPCEVLRTREPDLAKPAPRYVPCTRRAREELGLIDRIDLTDAIARTMRWHQRRQHVNV